MGLRLRLGLGQVHQEVEEVEEVEEVRLQALLIHSVAASIRVARSAVRREPDRRSARPAVPTAAPEAPVLDVRGMFRRFLPYARPYRRWLALTMIFVLLGPLLDSAAIWLFKILVDDILTPRDFQAFFPLAAAYTGITVAVGAVSFADRYLSVWVGERFLTDLRTDLYRHLHTLSLDFFERRQLGDVLSRLTGDVTAIESVILSGINRVVSYAVRIVLYGGALFFLSWQLALLAVVVAPIFWAIARVLSRRLKEASRESRRQTGALSGAAEEGLGNTALVRAYNRQDSDVERFARHNVAVMAAQLRSTRIRGVISPLGQLVELVGLLLVIGFGTWQLSRNEITLGEMLVFMAFFGQLYSPLRGVGRLGSSWAAASASAERLVEVLDARPAVPEPDSPEPLDGVRGVVEMRNVCFRYPGHAVDVLHDVSFHVSAGQRVAIVGSSGAGKSTVAKLLLRHYDPTAGSVLLDGHDLREVSLADLRDNVGVVMQETLVFDGTVEENVRWGRPDASDDELRAAAAAADVDRVVARLPQGFGSRVGQRGRRLSGGERQRVAIARAMLRDTPVLLLDEPTTGLDAASAARIRDPLRRLMVGRTTIVITHHLGMVTDADLILVLDEGRIVQRGRHAELLRRRGLYRTLYREYTRDGSDATLPEAPDDAAWWWAARRDAGPAAS